MSPAPSSPPPPKPRLSIVIVNWSTRGLLRACLESIPRGAPPEPYEIVVVDNGSTDGSAEMARSAFPRVRLLANAVNEGFARGTNQGVEKARGRLILLLNTDVVVLPESIRILCDFLAHHPSTGVAVPQLRYPGGPVQKSCRGFPTPMALLCACLGLDALFPKNAKANAWRMGHWDHGDTRCVEQPMMSAFLARRECWEEVGPLDENFPVYFNDVDWCYRLFKSTSWRIHHVSDAVMAHRHGQTCRRLGTERIAHSNRGLLRFYAKHWIPKDFPAWWPLGCAALGIVAACRFLADGLACGRRKAPY